MSDPVSTPSAAPASPTPQATPTPDATNTQASSQAPVAQVVENAQETLNDPSATPAEKQEAKKMLKKLTLKIDGQEFEENLPFEIPDDPKAIEYMRRELQMGRMGQKRAQEKAVIEKEVLQFFKALKEDPEKALSDPAIGIDVKDLAAKVIEREIENSKKSPEQLELEKARRELKELKDKQENDKQQREAQEKQQLTDKYAEEYDQQITTALETGKIPKSPAAVKKILDYMQLAVDANKDVSINDILPIIKEELVQDYRTHAQALPDDALEEFFGKDIIERIRKQSVAKVKKTATNPAVNAPIKTQSTGKSSAKTEEVAPKMKYGDFFKLNRKS